MIAQAAAFPEHLLPLCTVEQKTEALRMSELLGGVLGSSSLRPKPQVPYFLLTTTYQARQIQVRPLTHQEREGVHTKAVWRNSKKRKELRATKC